MGNTNLHIYYVYIHVAVVITTKLLLDGGKGPVLFSKQAYCLRGRVRESQSLPKLVLRNLHEGA